MQQTQMQHILRNRFALSYALSISLGIAIAYLLSQYLQLENSFWLLITTFLLAHTSRGAPMRVLLRHFLLILAGYFISSVFLASITIIYALYFFLAIIFVSASFFLLFIQSVSAQIFYSIFIIPLVLILNVFITHTLPISFYDGLVQVLMGAGLAIIIRLCYPIKFYQELRLGITPVLTAAYTYFEVLGQFFLTADTSVNQLFYPKLKLEKELQNSGNYPEWVYQPGFNPGLRSGFRFFMIHLEQVMEVLFALTTLTQQVIDQKALTALHEPLTECWHKNAELLKNVMIALQSQSYLSMTNSDYTSDIVRLEEKLKEFVPQHLELLSMSPQDVTLIALVRNIKDMRTLLLQLLMSLPK